MGEVYESGEVIVQTVDEHSAQSFITQAHKMQTLSN